MKACSITLPRPWELQHNAYSNRFIARMIKFRMQADESLGTYMGRRNAAVARFKCACDFEFRFRWAYKLTTWVEHLYRNQECLPFILVKCQDDMWLRTCRLLAGGLESSRSLDAGATNTRTAPGAPSRWAETWVDFMQNLDGGWENSQRSKACSKERASILAANFLRRPSGLLAIA